MAGPYGLRGSRGESRVNGPYGPRGSRGESRGNGPYGPRGSRGKLRSSEARSAVAPSAALSRGAQRRFHERSVGEIVAVGKTVSTAHTGLEAVGESSVPPRRAAPLPRAQRSHEARSAVFTSEAWKIVATTRFAGFVKVGGRVVSTVQGPRGSRGRAVSPSAALSRGAQRRFHERSVGEIVAVGKTVSTAQGPRGSRGKLRSSEARSAVASSAAFPRGA
ncbi:hypothetical protein L21SP4_00612 [Kiritimatiella glycovorans]|uniref:Collagen triple helix repeat (20 copies) n=1 Tax=Kiritimatiella glycovorans TaxID=1307763 RepID=A0A0G3EBP9_9BACT|nr:hypothetical protein L21SP4_00612 [Kiritimatiella glycovorans]